MSAVIDGATVAKRITLTDGVIDAIDAVQSQHRFPPHFHDTFAFGIIESGFHRFVTVRGTWIAGPGSVLAIAPGETHSVGALSRGGYSYRMVYPTVDFMSRQSEMVRDACSRFALFREPVFMNPDIFSDLSSALQGNLSATDTSRLLLNALLACFERYLSPPTECADAHRQIADLSTFGRACEFLRRHLAQPVQLSSVAEHCGISAFQLNRLFVRTAGVPPHAFLIQLRVNRAQTLLSRGHSIADATYACGFSDQSHLNRLFKRTVGVAPGRFLRALRSSTA